MIRHYNASKLARSSFFRQLIQYVDQEGSVTLRQIKEVFPDQAKLNRQLEAFIEAGYIERRNRRYQLAFTYLTSLEGIALDSEVFVESDSSLLAALEELHFLVELVNETNQAIIQEEVDFLRQELTLSSYFYKVREQLPLSPEQEELFHLLGDVNYQYAMKYLTTFLLKFARKERVIQKRPDIFVEALLLLGYIKKIDEQAYQLTMELDRENLVFRPLSDREKQTRD